MTNFVVFLVLALIAAIGFYAAHKAKQE